MAGFNFKSTSAVVPARRPSSTETVTSCRLRRFLTFSMTPAVTGYGRELSAWEQALLLRRDRALLAARAVFIHALTRDLGARWRRAAADEDYSRSVGVEHD